MKPGNLIFAIVLCLLIFTPAFARDFRPDGHLENIPLTDSSIQQCYVFRTTAGVRYTVESSADLTNWTAQDDIYGMGNEYAVTLREFTPAPPPPPGTPPTTHPSPPSNASVRLQRASGGEGGTVVSWASLDHGGPVIVRIVGNMVPAWNQIPLFWDRYGSYNFFIWHPNDTATPPAENPILATKDSAMLAVLEASLPAMNQQVVDSVVRSRNAPPPAPPAPGSRKFLRLLVDATPDTDSDGSPDWAEFEIAAREAVAPPASFAPDPDGPQNAPAPPARGDPYDADTNNDGIPDGQQLDADLDGTPASRTPTPPTTAPLSRSVPFRAMPSSRFREMPCKSTISAP